MKKTGLNGYVYDFSVDYDAITVDDILDIHKYLMEKNDPLSVNSLESVSMSNQECTARPKIINVNNNEPVFYTYNIKVNKCSGSCNNINNLFAKLCVADVIKNINVKVFN